MGAENMGNNDIEYHMSVSNTLQDCFALHGEQNTEKLLKNAYSPEKIIGLTQEEIFFIIENIDSVEHMKEISDLFDGEYSRSPDYREISF